MAIYRGPGGAGDATGDATNASALALAAKDEAQASATSAASSATAASNSATAASTSASDASTSATNAAGSATTASTAATNASNSATAADTSADAAAASASDAADSATAAASSATSASTDASTASTQATNAASSASSASTSASTATTKASEAATSATNAASSATTASTAATNASNSASAAATSETNAASSASSASTSASTATTKASEASSSASSASTSASTATTQASNAASSASAASTSASNASNSAASASTSASNAATSATNAAASATSAATSASNAAATLANALVKTNNLSDVSSASTARSNLGLVIGTNVQAYSSELQAISSSGNAMFKNRIINGAMMIDQRNAGASVTPSATATFTYLTDRFAYNGNLASKFTLGQNLNSVTLPTGFQKYLGAQVASAVTIGSTDYFYLAHRIEGLNVADLGWGTAAASTVTLSFKVYSSLTGTFGGSLRNSDLSRSYPFSFTVSSANTWTDVSVTIAGDTSGTWLKTNGTGIEVAWSLGIGSTYSGAAGTWASANYASVTGAVSVVGTSGATFYITGVQLEKGSTATSFDYRPYGTELALCQRYYEKTSNIIDGTNGPSGGFSRTNWFYKVTKRTTPTITAAGGSSGTVGTVTDDFAVIYIAGTASAYFNTGSTAVAEL